jgi:diguanylate cyclase (GGDEF)-like protein
MSVSLNIAMVDLGEERAAASDQRRASIVALVLIVCCALIAPVMRLPLGISYPIFAIVIALSIAAISVTSVLLWAQARVTRSAPLSVLALGYALTSLVMLPYMLFFHGMWPQLINVVSADTETSAWLYIEWHLVFLCSMLAYFGARRYFADRAPLDAPAFRSFRRRLYWIGAAIIGFTVPPLIWADDLPRLGSQGHATALFVVVTIVIVATALAAIVVAYRSNRFRAVLDLWLAVACLSMIADIVLTLLSRQFTAGWYVSRLSILLGASSVLSVLLFQTANIYAQLAVTAERLRNESLTDPLTGLANRRRFDQHFEAVMRDAARSKRPVGLLMLDIDNFKSYNDTYGHQAGDECLRAIALLINDNIGRARDLAARTGGEEMAVIMPEADIRGALTVAERIRAAVEGAVIPQGRGALHKVVTVSIGVTSTLDPAGARIENIIESADRALYRAKSSGRNCVVESFELVAGLPDA